MITTPEIATIFSSALLLIAVYFWYDTIKMILDKQLNVNNPNHLTNMIVLTIFLTVVVIILVYWLKNTYPSNQNDLPGPPPQSFLSDSRSNFIFDNKENYTEQEEQKRRKNKEDPENKEYPENDKNICINKDVGFTS